MVKRDKIVIKDLSFFFKSINLEISLSSKKISAYITREQNKHVIGKIIILKKN